jgi:hypothetical protein
MRRGGRVLGGVQSFCWRRGSGSTIASTLPGAVVTPTNAGGRALWGIPGTTEAFWANLVNKSETAAPIAPLMHSHGGLGGLDISGPFADGREVEHHNIGVGDLNDDAIVFLKVPNGD